MATRARITPDGRTTEVSTEQADEEKGARIYSGAALHAPEHWKHRKYRLTMDMLDSFDCNKDDMNVLATTIYRRTPRAIIYGSVYIGNANEEHIIDYTKEYLTYICRQVFKPQNS